MTAHEYGELLKCAIPLLEGLLPEPHNTRLLKLLFTMAYWHGFGGLHMHTDATTEILDNLTTLLGQRLRHFKDTTCAVYATRELKREAEQRHRREDKAKLTQLSSSKTTAAPGDNRRLKTLNLDTFKLHALGDYVASIPRKAKKLDPMFAPKTQYHIGENESSPVDVPLFLSRNHGDPAVKDFLPKLHAHLLPRIVNLLKQERILHPDIVHPVQWVSDTAADVEGRVSIHHDRIYHHKQVWFNYTMYDVHRGRDIINCGTPHRNIMLLSSTTTDSDSDSKSRFLYARVLGAYHANVLYMGPGMLDYKPRRIDFLWVRWYEVQRGGTTSWRDSELPMVSFPALASDSAFGFIDPSDVLRACHVIPAFARGTAHEDGVGVSLRARDGDDYNTYYVGCFSDRDSLMRYHWGMGVGHIHAHGLAEVESLTPVGALVAEVEVEADVDTAITGISGSETNSESTNELAGSKTCQVQAGSGPSCEDPTLNTEVDNDDDLEAEDEEDDDKSGEEMPEIDDELDDSQYPGL
ncbi:hypothetical protein GSI_04622 [Ganoderma sinense ZZ0214-1]|uniref:Uncharacterized protein n=1 Tax=Ganoderma sinense ZZ0214-1 TaxID=1077348 RepID=A0A2G8SHD0_9APHY|nr:hypothetical protein GSI_04622 [Ganoderma sinense ZZ0214-1]